MYSLTFDIDSIYKLSEELKLDPQFNVLVSEIVLNDFNPDEQGKNKVSGSVILAIKKLIQYLFPEFTSEILDTLLQILIVRDPEPLRALATKLHIPLELVNLIIALIWKDEIGINQAIQDLLQQILPEE